MWLRLDAMLDAVGLDTIGLGPGARLVLFQRLATIETEMHS